MNPLWIWRFGSLIIDYEIIGSINNSDSFKTDLAKCMTQLLSGKINITVLQQTQVILTVTIKDQSGLQLTSKEFTYRSLFQSSLATLNKWYFIF